MNRKEMSTVLHLAATIAPLTKALSLLADQAQIQGSVLESRPDLAAAARTILRTLLPAARREPDLIAGIARRSYLHDNGFVKLVLLQQNHFPQEFRIHLWLAPQEPSRERLRAQNIHNHSADFVSILLSGTAVESVFSADPLNDSSEPIGAPMVARRFACGSRGERSNYTMSDLGPATLRLLRQDSVRAGDVHSLRYDLLHRLQITEYPLITVFFQGPRRQTGTTAFVVDGGSSGEVVPSPALSTSSVLDYFDLIWQSLPMDTDS